MSSLCHRPTKKLRYFLDDSAGTMSYMVIRP
jgi:hypothetical protein